MTNSNIELACQCGGSMIIRKSEKLSINNQRIEKWTRDHERCRQAYILRTNAEARRTLLPGEILETLNVPDYTEALNNIAEHLLNIEANTRKE